MNPRKLADTIHTIAIGLSADPGSVAQRMIGLVADARRQGSGISVELAALAALGEVAARRIR